MNTTIQAEKATKSRSAEAIIAEEIDQAEQRIWWADLATKANRDGFIEVMPLG